VFTGGDGVQIMEWLQKQYPQLFQGKLSHEAQDGLAHYGNDLLDMLIVYSLHVTIQGCAWFTFKISPSRYAFYIIVLLGFNPALHAY
jgi:hypothetical protein